MGYLIRPIPYSDGVKDLSYQKRTLPTPSVLNQRNLEVHAVCRALAVLSR
jgi:hypothetical protein